jgi:hypothetical protein
MSANAVLIDLNGSIQTYLDNLRLIILIDATQQQHRIRIMKPQAIFGYFWLILCTAYNLTHSLTYSNGQDALAQINFSPIRDPIEKTQLADVLDIVV